MQFTKSSIGNRNVAIEILDSLKTRLIILDDTTLGMVLQDPKFDELRNAISKIIASCLPNTVEASNPKYSLGKVSEFDLYFNCSTIKSRELFATVNEKFRDASYAEHTLFAKHSITLRKWIIAQRRSLIGKYYFLFVKL